MRAALLFGVRRTWRTTPSPFRVAGRVMIKHSRLLPRLKEGLDQPAFNRTRLKAEKLIDSKVLEQPASKRTRAALNQPAQQNHVAEENQTEDQNHRRNVEAAQIRQHFADGTESGFCEPI